MPSPKAVLADITNFKLNPRKEYHRTNVAGHLTPNYSTPITVAPSSGPPVIIVNDHISSVAEDIAEVEAMPVKEVVEALSAETVVEAVVVEEVVLETKIDESPVEQNISEFATDVKPEEVTQRAVPVVKEVVETNDSHKKGKFKKGNNSLLTSKTNLFIDSFFYLTDSHSCQVIHFSNFLKSMRSITC